MDESDIFEIEQEKGAERGACFEQHTPSTETKHIEQNQTKDEDVAEAAHRENWFDGWAGRARLHTAG